MSMPNRDSMGSNMIIRMNIFDNANPHFLPEVLASLMEYVHIMSQRNHSLA